MHSTQINAWLNRMALVVLSATMFLASGCAHVYHLTHYNALGYLVADQHRPYYQSPHTGRIIAKTHGHFCPTEPACFGFEPTCWTPWPAQCPQQCNQPYLGDGTIVVEEVVHPAPTAVAPEEIQVEDAADSSILDEATEAQVPLDAIPADEGIELQTPVDPTFEPASPSDRELFEDSESDLPADVTPTPLDATPSTILDVLPEDDTSSRLSPPTLDAQATETAAAPAVEKQLLEDQVIEQCELPTTTEAAPMAVWDASIPRREIDQRMVLVDDTRVSREFPIDHASEALPMIVEGPEPSALPPTAAPIPPVEEPQPERFVVAADSVDRESSPGTESAELPAADLLLGSKAEMSQQPIIDESAPTTKLQLAEAQPMPSAIPSFKILAVPPPQTRIVESVKTAPMRVSTGATIRFTAEKTSSERLELETAGKPARDSSLRFR